MKKRIYTHARICLLLISSLLFLASCSSDSPTGPGNDAKIGNSYFVSASGNDENDGSPEKPWKTIHFGIAQLKAGDTLTVREGTYRLSSLIHVRNRGESDRWIVIRGEPGKRVNIDANPANIGWDSRYP